MMSSLDDLSDLRFGFSWANGLFGADLASSKNGSIDFRYSSNLFDTARLNCNLFSFSFRSSFSSFSSPSFGSLSSSFLPCSCSGFFSFLCCLMLSHYFIRSVLDHVKSRHDSVRSFIYSSPGFCFSLASSLTSCSFGSFTFCLFSCTFAILVFSTTNIAEFVATSASHVVTSLVFGNYELASGAPFCT